MQIYRKKYHELETDELYSILRLRNQIFIVEQKCYYEDIDGTDKTADHIFMKEDGEIISYIRIFREEHCHIGRVLVEKSRRGRGYSRELLNYGIDYIFNVLGEDIIEIEAQDYLRKFYESLGFTAESEVYLLDNIPHLQMKLEK